MHFKLLSIEYLKDFVFAIKISCTSGSKNGKHGSITESSNISAVSYCVVQLFEYTHGHHFHHMPIATSRLQTRQFALLPSMRFLSLLSSQPKIHSATGTIELSSVDYELFAILKNTTGKLAEAIILSRKRDAKQDYPELTE
jgi:hypothetical protein